MNVLVGVLRLLLVLIVILLGAIVCIFAGILSRGVFSKIAMCWHRSILFAIGVRPKYRGAELIDGALLLSNHVSWIDILLYGSRAPVIFLGTSDILSWPVLGWVIARAGTLFIERGKGATKAVSEIGAALKRRQTIVLFPEGRTTDGTSVLRFQPRLLQSAVDAAAPVQPAAIRYFDAAGKRAAHLSFEGDITLLGSAWKAVSGARATAEITLFDALPSSDQRHVLADQAEQRVREWIESRWREKGEND